MAQNNLLRKILNVYLKPILLSPRLYRFTKDIFFSKNNEHIYRSVNYIKKHKPSNRTGRSIIVDIGAHGGGFTCVFAKSFKECLVIGYDPLSTLFQEKIKQIKKYSNIIYFNKALGNESGSKTLNVTKHNYSSSFLEINSQKLDESKSKLLEVEDKLEVEISTLDKELKNYEDILLMKIDVQGYEYEILKGGINSLKKTNYILIELSNHEEYVNNKNYYEIDEFLRNNHFTLCQIYSPLGDASEFDCLYKNSSI